MVARNRRGIPRDAVAPGRPNPGDRRLHGPRGEIAPERAPQETEIAPQPGHLLEEAAAGHGLSRVGGRQAPTPKHVPANASRARATEPSTRAEIDPLPRLMAKSFNLK